MSGLAIHGKLLVEHPEIHNPQLLQNEFEFERQNPADGFENQKLFRLRYSSDYVIKARGVTRSALYFFILC